jgi:hypothetical protein
MKDVKIAKSDPAVYNKKFWCSLKQKYPFVMSNQDISVSTQLQSMSGLGSP